jgi:predicted Ser/Thr protein kinase
MLYILWDNSASIPASARQALLRAVEDLGPATVIVYGVGARLSGTLPDSGQELRSDLGAAVRLLVSQLQVGDAVGVVIVTDGYPTDDFDTLNWIPEGLAPVVLAQSVARLSPGLARMPAYTPATLPPAIPQPVVKSLPVISAVAEEDEFNPYRVGGLALDKVSPDVAPTVRTVVHEVDLLCLRPVDAVLKTLSEASISGPQVLPAIEALVREVEGEPDDTGCRLYDLLQVHPAARVEVIEAAYDALRSAQGPSRRLTHAYTVLSDQDRRRAYDAGREPLGKIIEGFKIESVIATGGYGTTYKGVHVLTGGPVCAKHCSRISPEDTQVLIEETRALWDLRHYALPAARNLVQMPDQSVILFMSYIEGPTLWQAVDKLNNAKQRMDPEHVGWIASRLLNALSYMHRHGVAHGDLKPQNIILQPDKHGAFLVDFGLAAVKPNSSTKSRGYTELFAAPEQFMGAAPNPRSDLYSFAVTMIYALTGDLDLTAGRRVPQDMPDPFARFLAKFLSPDPLKRADWSSPLLEEFEAVRTQSFGRNKSGFKPLQLPA